MVIHDSLFALVDASVVQVFMGGQAPSAAMATAAALRSKQRNVISSFWNLWLLITNIRSGVGDKLLISYCQSSCKHGPSWQVKDHLKDHDDILEVIRNVKLLQQNGVFVKGNILPNLKVWFYRMCRSGFLFNFLNIKVPGSRWYRYSCNSALKPCILHVHANLKLHHTSDIEAVVFALNSRTYQTK